MVDRAGAAAPQVPAAERALALLRFLATQPRPVSAASIARALSLPRSSSYHLLDALERHGFVTHFPEERRYGMGVAAFEIGSAYVRHRGLERLARPLLVELVAATGDTAHLGVLDGREVVYLLKEQPPRPDPLVTDVGVRLPAHLTASGRCQLAHLPAPQVAAVFPTPGTLSNRTGRGPRSLAELRGRLERERRQGWAVEDGEVTAGFTSLAVAALTHTGHPAASIGVTFRRARRAPATWPDLGALVTDAADRLSRRLGGSPAG